MKPFIFRLQTALDMKINMEEQAKLELERANRNLAESEEELQGLNLHLERINEQVREVQRKGFQVEDLKTYDTYIPVQVRKIDLQKEVVEERRQNLNKVRAALVEIMKDRKVLEKIKTRHYQEYLRQVLLEEQKQIDEMALQRFTRKDKPS